MTPSITIKSFATPNRTLVYTHADATPAIVFGGYSNILGIDARLIVEIETSGAIVYQVFDKSVPGEDYPPDRKSGQFSSDPWLATGDKLYVYAAASNQAINWEDINNTLLWEDVNNSLGWDNVGASLSGNVFSLNIGIAK